MHDSSSTSSGSSPLVTVVHFMSDADGDGDGSYEGQMGHAYLELDDGATGDESVDLGIVTLARAREIAAAHGADLDIDGPTREEWDAI